MNNIDKKQWMQMLYFIQEAHQIDASTTPDDLLIPIESMLSGYYEMLAGYKASKSLLGKENANE